MQRQLRFRPRLEALEDRLPPGDLRGSLAVIGQLDLLQDELAPADVRDAPADVGQPCASVLEGRVEVAAASAPSSDGNAAPGVQSRGSFLLPPESHAFGMSFEEWGFLYARWAIETNLAAETDLSDTVGPVRFLPTVTDSGSHEFSVTLQPGTPFVATPFFIFGERYDDPAVRDDTPQDVIDFMLFETADIRTVLDGQVLLEGTGTELERFMFGPVYFDEPIVYAEPQPRGPALNAVAALFTQGIGTLFRPLPVGEHTLVNTLHSPFFGDFQFTYHITVSPTD